MSSSTDDKDGKIMTGGGGNMKKFMFDNNDFDDTVAPVDKPVYTEDQLVTARNQSLAQGRSEGLQEARTSQEEKIHAVLQRMSQHIDTLVAAEDRRDMQASIDALRLSLRIVHKLMPQFAHKFSLGEIEHVILAAIEARRDEPRLAVTVPGQHLEPLRARIDQVALEKGYAGRIILIADDNMSPADCRVEWADGGAERLYERLYLQIETEFAKAIAGMESAQADENKN